MPEDGITKKELREAYRNYVAWKDIVSHGGPDILSFGLSSVCFWDLERALRFVWPRLTRVRREAFYRVIILDEKQNDARKAMGYSSVVPVQQYVDYVLGQLLQHVRGGDDV